MPQSTNRSLNELIRAIKRHRDDFRGQFPAPEKYRRRPRLSKCHCFHAFILFATNWPDPVKYGLFIFGCSIFVFIWFFLRQRRKNVSRDAVDIEKSLTKEAAKSTPKSPKSPKSKSSAKSKPTTKPKPTSK